MDSNIKWLQEMRINNTIKALEKNNMNGYLVNNKEELILKLDELVPKNSKVACGGSMTLFEVGVIEYLRQEKFKFMDRYKLGLTAEEIRKVYIDSFSADVYFSSSNAITEDGGIYNVDGNGNRVAALLYGPEKVIIIVGINKIVSNIEEAIERNRRISAPANCKRLYKQTPCVTTGYCMDCSSPEKICREYTFIKSQANKDRIHIIFMNEQLGY